MNQPTALHLFAGLGGGSLGFKRAPAPFNDYIVASNGRVYSTKSGEPRELTPTPTGNGYLKVGLYADGDRKYFSVHQLVAQCFIGDTEGCVVHHRNEDKADNRVENLEVMAHDEHSQHHNQIHSVTSECAVCGNTFRPHKTKRGIKKTCSRECFARLASRHATAQMAGKPAPSAKLSADDVRDMRDRHANGESMRSIARSYDVHHGTVSRAVKREAWSWVD